MNKETHTWAIASPLYKSHTPIFSIPFNDDPNLVRSRVNEVRTSTLTIMRVYKRLTDFLPWQWFRVCFQGYFLKIWDKSHKLCFKEKTTNNTCFNLTVKTSRQIITISRPRRIINAKNNKRDKRQEIPKDNVFHIYILLNWFYKCNIKNPFPYSRKSFLFVNL